MFTYAQPISISPAAKAHVDAQISLLNDLVKKLFNTAHRVNELHIQIAQSLIEESITSAQQVLESKDPFEAFSIAAAQVQPAGEKMRAYQQHLTNIAAGTQLELAKTAEAHVPETSRTAEAVADEVARKASEETEKATQRQKVLIEKLSKPITIKPDNESRRQA
jgi:phasin family protein